VMTVTDAEFQEISTASRAFTADSSTSAPEQGRWRSTLATAPKWQRARLPVTGAAMSYRANTAPLEGAQGSMWLLLCWRLAEVVRIGAGWTANGMDCRQPKRPLISARVPLNWKSARKPC
jgi:hypothetical protein